MKTVVAEAPGKVVVLGEYAVLEGVPALALAVDRHARVELRPCRPGQCRVDTPQLGMAPARFGLTGNGGIDWAEPPTGAFERTADLIEYLLAGIHDQGGRIRPFSLHIDTAALFHATGDGETKLGLGSSAAVAVALDAALLEAFGAGRAGESAADVVRRLLVPVRRAQAGSGSGLDLAASRVGGLIAYRIEGLEISLESLHLPEDLRLLYVWTGVSASTTDFVARWRDVRREDPHGSDALLAEMAECVEAGLAALKVDDGAAFARQIGAYGRIMGKMNDLMRVPVVTAAHRTALDEAARLGVAYKPCGAGGGDLGIAASTRTDRLAELSRRLQELGLETLALTPDSRGVVIRNE
ncbi:MAG: mevalonate kinase [Wenzhouxiangella sp.]